MWLKNCLGPKRSRAPGPTIVVFLPVPCPAPAPPPWQCGECWRYLSMPFLVRGRVVHHRGMGILVARARQGHGPGNLSCRWCLMPTLPDSQVPRCFFDSLFSSALATPSPGLPRRHSLARARNQSQAISSQQSQQAQCWVASDQLGFVSPIK